MLVMSFILAFSQTTSGPAVTLRVEKGPVSMSAAEIRSYNARLARDDPHYIRCARTAVTGSLSREHTTCRTNAEWRKKEELGNTVAREFIDDANGSRGA